MTPNWMNFHTYLSFGKSSEVYNISMIFLIYSLYCCYFLYIFFFTTHSFRIFLFPLRLNTFFSPYMFTLKWSICNHSFVLCQAVCLTSYSNKFLPFSIQFLHQDGKIVWFMMWQRKGLFNIYIILIILREKN